MTSAPQEAELTLQAPHEAARAPTAADLAALVDQLEDVIAEADPQKNAASCAASARFRCLP